MFGGNWLHGIALTVVAESGLLCERTLPVTVLPDHRKVIKEIVQAAPDGVLLSELPQKFEVPVTSYYHWCLILY